ncbi:Rhs element Vgr protein (fragment) [Xenorhabdus bovienii str. Jollieti]|uniref:Rhs element Vgr protein n=1 Tax=Xenorhabdus bovienii (strain SS-2004) TaxID=406818 RepID=D3UYS5_XENBS
MIFQIYSFLRAAHTLTVGGVMNTAVALSQSEQVGVHKSVIVGNTLSIKAGDVIELQCGASTLRMDSSGKITLIGTEFKFEASGPVQITGKDIDLN